MNISKYVHKTNALLVLLFTRSHGTATQHKHRKLKQRKVEEELSYQLTISDPTRVVFY